MRLHRGHLILTRREHKSRLIIRNTRKNNPIRADIFEEVEMLYPAKKLFNWCINTTFLVSVTFLVSTQLGVDERGAYAYAMLSVLYALAYIITRGQKLSEAWVSACITTAFTVSAAASVLTLVTVLAKHQEYGEYGLMIWVFSAFMTLVAVGCFAFFSFLTASQLKVKYRFALLVFGIQSIVLYIVFAYAPAVIQKFFAT